MTRIAVISAAPACRPRRAVSRPAGRRDRARRPRAGRGRRDRAAPVGFTRWRTTCSPVSPPASWPRPSRPYRRADALIGSRRCSPRATRALQDVSTCRARTLEGKLVLVGATAGTARHFAGARPRAAAALQLSAGDRRPDRVFAASEDFGHPGPDERIDRAAGEPVACSTAPRVVVPARSRTSSPTRRLSRSLLRGA